MTSRNARTTDETKSAPEDYAKAERIRGEIAETRKNGTITVKSATTGRYLTTTKNGK